MTNINLNGEMKVSVHTSELRCAIKHSHNKSCQNTHTYKKWHSHTHTHTHKRKRVG